MSLVPKEGAVMALHEMRSKYGMTVLLCSAPLVSSRYSAQEKLDWVRYHMGEEWLDRVILTCRFVSLCLPLSPFPPLIPAF